MNMRQGIIMGLAIAVVCNVVHAETEKVGDYTWQYFVRDGKAWIGSQVAETAAVFPKPVGEVVVPSELGGYEVFRIDDYALCDCNEMTKLIIPDCVHQLGTWTFWKDAALCEIVLPHNLEWVPEQAFRGCSSLREVMLPPNVTRIDGDAAFGQCHSLTNIVIPSSVRSIGNNTFLDCRSLKEVIIPNSVTNIGVYAFSYCTGLERLTLPFIGSERGNVGTAESVFGHIFGLSAREGLTKVEQIYADPNKITRYIPASLKHVTVTDELIIPLGAFQNCSNLTSVVIGNSVTNIAKGAFSGCGSLERMTLPFTGKCRDALEWNIDHCECSLGYIFGSDSYSGSVGVKAYGSNGFSYYYLPAKLTSIAVIGTEQIRSYAFYNCTTLTNITIDADAKSIGYQTFGNCKCLKQIEIPDGVVGLGSNTFRGSGLESIRIPLSVTDMTERKGANFLDCTSLRLAYIPRWFKGKLPESTFQNCAPDLQIIYYDENMKFFNETLTTEDSASTNIVAVCTNDCRVSFKWKCSCEPLFKNNLYDYLSFEIDGVRQDFICGETGWQTKSYEVSGDGEHTFRWIYQKDEQDSAGEDCGWVKHVVVAPRVTLTFDGGEAPDGEAPAAMSFYADDETVTLPGCGTLFLAKHSFAGWSDGEKVYAAGAACPHQNTAQTLTAVWAANTLSAPVITAPETYEADSATVTIAADDGATVYYTLDGSTPEADGTGCRPYQGPFAIEGSATIKAIAVKDDNFDSEVASFTVTRPTWTYGEYLNCPERMFTMGGNTEWVREKGVSADGYALRSGEVTHGQTSRLETVVYGAGIIAFRCKVDGEIVKKIVYDGLAFCVDGEQQGDLMGDADWTEKTFTVTGDGRHVLSWLYVKDEEGDGGGADCAWLDNVVWAPDDPLPPLDVTATDEDADAIIAGLSDSRLPDKIGSIAAYTAFRNWVDGKGLSHSTVRDAPNAWLSYALDAPGLMAKPQPLASEDVVIESIPPSSTANGTFDLTVSIAGAEIGEAARLAEVLGIEGAAELKESAFSSEGLTVSLDRTDDGNAKATVAPYGAPSSFFLRVRIK